MWKNNLAIWTHWLPSPTIAWSKPIGTVITYMIIVRISAQNFITALALR